MAKKILFASGDVGGARALIPVIRTATEQGHLALVLRHGFIAQERRENWQWLTPTTAETESLDAALREADPDVVIFATSVKDSTALKLARLAQARGTKVVHVLDSWATYQERMVLDGLPPFYPNIYAVMDTAAAEAAAHAGISKPTIRITGQPGLSHIMLLCPPNETQRLRRGDTVRRFLFVSEPIKTDQGSSDESRSYRGYTEQEVIVLLCRALQPLADQVYLSLLPHPREDETGLAAAWESNRQSLQGEVLPKALATTPVADYDGVIGMASILLYEAWLLGRPTLSLQPGLQLEALRQIGCRPGALLIESKENAEDQIQAWVNGIEINSPVKIHADAELHATAPQTVLSLALEFANTRNGERK
jgi:hypothetical protein